jgi:hypothetical protein
MAGDGGLCAIHGGRQDPRELGRKGGRVGKGSAAIRKLPARAQLSLRERLRGLDHETVNAACEEILAGGNQTAKVQVIRLPCDLEVYRDNDPDERERQAQIHRARRRRRRARRSARARPPARRGPRADPRGARAGVKPMCGAWGPRSRLRLRCCERRTIERKQSVRR